MAAKTMANAHSEVFVVNAFTRRALDIQNTENTVTIEAAKFTSFSSSLKVLADGGEDGWVLYSGSPLH